MDVPPPTWADPTSLHPPHGDLQHKVHPCKVPTSILRSRSNLIGSSPELSHRQKSVRRVRFRDPEFTVYTYNRGSGRPHLALLTYLALLLSVLVMALFYTGWHQSQSPCEGLPAALAEVVWGCWLWLTMQ
ncbi:hypothetical protein AAFF_G00240790 [Aldrovandia affinis]|uniref:Uncharacterized protein n=1 Tax=Aldrovandia affinis TaxID=143900 RepID=A0AAD7SUT3_9TELE|nr:hypothetical protein AAFF_G00240790 [Aldrovandia affinis]